MSTRAAPEPGRRVVPEPPRRVAERQVAGIWLVRDGRVLLLRRPSGLWAPPGGAVEPGEDVAVAALRETYEETGLRVEACEWLHAFPWQGAGPMRVHQFIAQAPAPGRRIRLSHEHTGHRWMTPASYAERYLREDFAAKRPRFGPWIREMRHVTGLVAAWIERGAPE